jgi:polyphosphate glucokinase
MAKKKQPAVNAAERKPAVQPKPAVQSKPVAQPKAAKVEVYTLAVDIGGTGIKAETLDASGQPINERERIPTPPNATPEKVVAIIEKLAKLSPVFNRVSVGFPGVVKDGVIYTAPNLGKGWTGFDLATALKNRLKRPVRIANDADVQGLGSITGEGLELVLTFGTGVGSVIFVEGHRIHLEVGHHPFHKGKTYEDELGARGLQKKGKKKWNKLLAEALDDTQRMFNYDRLYLGGGNTKFIKIKLPVHVTIVNNLNGLLGGIKLWEEKDRKTAPSPAMET